MPSTEPPHRAPLHHLDRHVVMRNLPHHLRVDRLGRFAPLPALHPRLNVGGAGHPSQDQARPHTPKDRLLELPLRPVGLRGESVGGVGVGFAVHHAAEHLARAGGG
eukprot:CAMPEP_0171306496 /NCGR_PEP_ID=MMETSP0816-20121228/16518_1 /TAXON_ID=420281 /ORGANISM="Proboscia inermis, Strain CCAP1064/1" /LENGTH=105 /DNA_ID=CAMNT_0011788115 /DNA_START=1468 /DNA_END=1781 /DNA_ORIENTATION=-